MNLDTTVEKGDANNTQRRIARKLVDLVKQGDTATQAASKMGIDLRRNKRLREAMQALMVEAGGVPMAVQRELVRATRLKTMIDSIGHEELKERELGLKAANQIAGDPDVGLNQPPQVAVKVDFGALEDIFRALTTDDTEVVDAEFEEVQSEVD